MSNVKEDWQPHINVIGNDIWFTGDVTLIGINDLIKEVQQCLNNKHVNSKVNLFISSPGGSISPAMVLHNYLNLNYKHINIIGTGTICSSATYFLFTKCDTYVYPNVYALFHPMSFEFNDNQQAVEARNKLYKHLTKCVNKTYLSKGFKCNWTKQDIYLFADDLISKGIVEGIWQQD